MTGKESDQTFWEKVAEANQWPDVIYLKPKAIKELPCFPFSAGGFRNRVTGVEADPVLKSAILQIGKYKAIEKKDLLPWLDSMTTDRRRTA